MFTVQSSVSVMTPVVTDLSVTATRLQSMVNGIDVIGLLCSDDLCSDDFNIQMFVARI